MLLFLLAYPVESNLRICLYYSGTNECPSDVHNQLLFDSDWACNLKELIDNNTESNTIDLFLGSKPKYSSTHAELNFSDITLNFIYTGNQENFTLRGMWYLYNNVIVNICDKVILDPYYSMIRFYVVYKESTILVPKIIKSKGNNLTSPNLLSARLNFTYINPQPLIDHKFSIIEGYLMSDAPFHILNAPFTHDTDSFVNLVPTTEGEKSFLICNKTKDATFCVAPNYKCQNGINAISLEEISPVLYLEKSVETLVIYCYINVIGCKFYNDNVASRIKKFLLINPTTIERGFMY